jgi:DNA primase
MPNLYESLMERLDGRAYGHYFSCFCPFDHHQSPAMLVFDDGMFKCLSCNKIGNHKELDRKIGTHFIPQRQDDTVSNILPRWRKWEEKYGDLEGIADAAHSSLKRFPQFQTYFKKRKIYEFIDEGNLGYLDGWVMFPVYSSSGKLVDIVVRSTKSTSIRYVVSPNDSGVHHLYIPSYKKIQESAIIYVVYGIIDAISLHLAGLPVVTGVTGKSLSPDLLKPLGKRFVIVPDAGEEPEAHKLANSIGWKARVKKIDFPDGCKDPDDIRKHFGNDYLLQALGA